jgi:hypothetical protein
MHRYQSDRGAMYATYLSRRRLFPVRISYIPFHPLSHTVRGRLGCPLVEKGCWKTNAPSDAFVIGLKELPENDTSPLSHPHIFFAHCYKKQSGWKEVLQRFDQGGGLILDMEFLNDENGM